MGHRHGNKGGKEQIITGAAITGVFAFLFFFLRHGFPWMIFPLVFAGVIPMLRGFSQLADERKNANPKERKITSKKDAEKAILKIAHNHKGKVSPTIVAMESSITLEEAEKYLGDLAGRGHASMNVKDTGSIEYVFTDLLPEDTSFE